MLTKTGDEFVAVNNRWLIDDSIIEALGDGVAVG